MNSIQLKNSRIDSISSIYKFHTTVDVLRLDLIHPVISGNKWFKLKKYLQHAKELNKTTVVTFGGAYSNHIVAAAAAAREYGLNSIGIIRGENSSNLSSSLQDAIDYGMKILFESREDYKKKLVPDEVYSYCRNHDVYLINEGGYGAKGAEGAKDILNEADAGKYTHIIAAAGTGTMLSGLTEASVENQKIIGISVFKNNFSLQKEIEKLISKEKQKRFFLCHDYHFGGYAKYTEQLIDFMNEWYRLTAIPSDFVYTGKLFFAVDDLIKKDHFSSENKLLIIHSGGLQGNRTLANGTLIF